jgi:(p)ppGpp synthase/HD superfamily hydrolase
MKDLMETVYHTAKAAHQGQKYGDGDYFSDHVCLVAETYEKLFDYDETGICVAYLHDIIEDTCEMYESVHAIFGDDIADAVNLLTKRKNTPYDFYLECVADWQLTARVKYCDSLVNLDKCIQTQEWDRAQKYLNNLKYLKEYI